MELFAVKRFDTEEKPDDPSKENRLLQKLCQNIERKKTQLQQQTQSKKIKLQFCKDEEKSKDEEESTEIMEVDGKPENDKDAEKEPAVQTTLDMGGSFVILGDINFQQRRSKVDAMLPSWLAFPTIISKNLTESSTVLIENINYIVPVLKDCLNAMNVKHLFPVQEAVIPWVLDVHSKPVPFRPRDVCVSAPTGSGKTLAYALPIVQCLLNSFDRKIRALIVLPVVELAVQVLKIFQKLSENTHLKCALLSKFTPFEIEQSQLVETFGNEYYSKVDIIVATTGRLVEHIHGTKGFCLKSLKFLVMDEADRIMEQLQNNWLYHLDNHVREQSDSFLSGRPIPLCYDALSNEAMREPHKLLFSATLSQDPEKLQNLRLFQPKLFTSIVKPFVQNESNYQNGEKLERRGEFIGKFTTPMELTEKYCLTQAKIKPLTLYTLIKENKWNRFLCFANSGESAHRLSYVLQSLLGSDVKIEELSSGLSPSLRNSVLLKFQTGKIDGIICSDALARGIDIPNVDVVISYDTPRHVKTYIHRIGRTARAGRPGTAVTILLGNELNAFQSIIKEGGKEAVEEIRVTENAEELKAKDYALALEGMQNALKREKQIKMAKTMSDKNKANNNKKGFISQLQSQVQRSDFVQVTNERNIPESWKWENQTKVNDKKERKGKNKKRKDKKNKHSSVQNSNE